MDLLANGNLSKLQVGSAQAFSSEREVRNSSNAPLISPANESNSRYEDFMMTAMRSEMMKNTELYSYLADKQLPVTGLSVYSRRAKKILQTLPPCYLGAVTPSLTDHWQFVFAR